jgi:hypothetical protein
MIWKEVSLEWDGVIDEASAFVIGGLAVTVIITEQRAKT